MGLNHLLHAERENADTVLIIKHKIVVFSSELIRYF